MSTKLTAKQREVLELMADGEHVLRHSASMSNFVSGYFYFKPAVSGRKFSEDMRTMRALEKRGLIHYGKLSDDWRGRDYYITDAGREALAKKEADNGR